VVGVLRRCLGSVALVALLGLEGDMEVVAELEHDDQILEEALATRPDVAMRPARICEKGRGPAVGTGPHPPA
jgi:hypothetical protein